MSKWLSLFYAAIFATASAFAGKSTIGFNFRDTDVTKVVEEYAKASGQKFIIDASVKGKVTVINPGDVTIEEAFNQLSSVLAVNGLGISKQEDTFVVSHARQVQRSLIEVGTELPPLKPEKMFTLVIPLKFVSAKDINNELRILTSRDGELVPVSHTNQLVVTDWVSNLYRVSKLIKEIDVQATPGKKKSATN